MRKVPARSVQVAPENALCVPVTSSSNSVEPMIALKVTAEIYLGNRRLARYLWTAPVICVLKLAWCWGAAYGLRAQKHNHFQNI